VLIAVSHIRLTPHAVIDDPYNSHFGAEPKNLTEQARTAVNERKWTTSKGKRGKLGEINVQTLIGTSNEENQVKIPVSVNKDVYKSRD
jgi:hypothetical protein